MDLRRWEFERAIHKPEFGYMWECPDLFWMSGKAFLSVSPQGLASEEFCNQNVYQSGYFALGKWNTAENISLGDFYEWDYGFDFYAPQTYEDEQGRRILLGWMGVPDAPYDHDPTIEEGWQHMLTLPRQLSVDDTTGRIRQTPLPELSALRVGLLFASRLEGKCMERTMECGYELLLSDIEGPFVEIDFCDGLTFVYDATLATCRLIFTKDAVGYGRDERRLRLASGKLSNLRVFVDRCSVELFMNDGEEVMTTKYFPSESPTLRLRACALAQAWELAEYRVLNLKS
jgi:beta-fructofuranosidase